MRNKTISLARLFSVNESLSPALRQEITLRSCLIVTEALLLILVPINAITWARTHRPDLLFNLVSDLLGMGLFAFVYLLNEKQLIKTASFLYLCGTFYISFAAIPVYHTEQLLVSLTLPTIIASLITRKEGSVVTAVIAVLSSIAYKMMYFPDAAFPYFSVLCLLMIGLIAMRVTIILDQILGQMSQAYDKTIMGWSKALEMRNQETEGHSERVVEMTLRLAKFMRVDRRMTPHIRRGVLLHDIGKIAVPDCVLCKTGPLTTSEFAIMHRHPEFAYDLLKDINYLAPAMQIPYCHHEKWDGTGYPRGLKGSDIPLEARIFSVVDVWDAMRSDRSYRKAIPENQVVEYLRCEKERSFDPVVINAFFRMMHFNDPEKGQSHARTVRVRTADRV
jgi:HD-GYP domain-containing protein (c-di-GMP phosphodiesterase class II)